MTELRLSSRQWQCPLASAIAAQGLLWKGAQLEKPDGGTAWRARQAPTEAFQAPNGLAWVWIPERRVVPWVGDWRIGIAGRHRRLDHTDKTLAGVLRALERPYTRKNCESNTAERNV